MLNSVEQNAIMMWAMWMPRFLSPTQLHFYPPHNIRNLILEEILTKKPIKICIQTWRKMNIYVLPYTKIPAMFLHQFSRSVSIPYVCACVWKWTKYLIQLLKCHINLILFYFSFSKYSSYICCCCYYYFAKEVFKWSQVRRVRLVRPEWEARVEVMVVVMLGVFIRLVCKVQ